jgi:hypothetical protein
LCPIRVRIISEKHGSHYHPARVELSTDSKTVSLAVNVAIAEPGLSRIKSEYLTITKLARVFKRKYTPTPYCLIKEHIPGTGEDDREAAIFIAQWLDHYHEFHLRAPKSDGVAETILWDTDSGYHALTEDQSRRLYEEAALIMTYYYDPHTFEEIFPWHHGAGDFVARVIDSRVSVRLISARQHAPRFVAQSGEPDQVKALLSFFANLSIRMRLDRAQGVGETIWAPDDILRSCVKGFFKGLFLKLSEGSVQYDLLRQFNDFTSNMGPEDWARLFGKVIDSYDPLAPDMPVIGKGMVDHIYLVYKTLGEREWLDRPPDVAMEQAGAATE